VRRRECARQSHSLLSHQKPRAGDTAWRRRPRWLYCARDELRDDSDPPPVPPQPPSWATPDPPRSRMRGKPLPTPALPSAPAAPAADCPQCRGPDGKDVSKEKGLLREWPKDGPKRLWTSRDAGAGFSGPAVVGNHLYMMGAEKGTEYLFALDLTTRKKAWSAE